MPGANAAYNETLAFTLTGPLDHDALARAFDALTVRHETLRTRLLADAGGVSQHIDPPGAGFALDFEDLTADADPDERVAERQRAEAERPFDLAAGPLGRGRLIALGARTSPGWPRAFSRRSPQPGRDGETPTARPDGETPTARPDGSPARRGAGTGGCGRPPRSVPAS
ncbi:condensation domain-containing protein [Streptomyces sp. NPDC004629]|uniref:condensation domain-containing protein n=1 Tax=Streptomyces sp. NPDC004629 TaxID=3364705 RepID=UPI0036AA4D3F